MMKQSSHKRTSSTKRSIDLKCGYHITIPQGIVGGKSNHWINVELKRTLRDLSSGLSNSSRYIPTTYLVNNSIRQYSSVGVGVGVSVGTHVYHGVYERHVGACSVTHAHCGLARWRHRAGAGVATGAGNSLHCLAGYPARYWNCELRLATRRDVHLRSPLAGYKLAGWIRLDWIGLDMAARRSASTDRAGWSHALSIWQICQMWRDVCLSHITCLIIKYHKNENGLFSH